MSPARSRLPKSFRSESKKPGTAGHRRIATQAGDFANAVRIAPSFQHANYKIQTQKAVVDAQIKAGDFAGAEKTAGSIEDVSARDTMRLGINLAKLKAGDIAGAQKGVDLIRDFC